MRGLTPGHAAVAVTDEVHGLVESPACGRVPRSFPEALNALMAAEAQLSVALQDGERMRADNESLRQALGSASRRAAAAQRAAHHDWLTGLPNRLFLIRRMQTAIATANQRRLQLALLFIDLDGFKDVNDVLGHAVGDRLLATVAARIAACVRSDDIACRYGGDEFVAMLTDLNDASIAVDISQKIRNHIAERYMIDGNQIRITASIGLAVYPDDGDRYDALLGRADAAMFRDKAARGRGSAECNSRVSALRRS